MPQVSVIINCYNGERYLEDALNSVLNQSFKDWEIIFYDNQSTDKSAEIFAKIQDDRCKYFRAERHTTLYAARNIAFSKCSGMFIAFLDVDDWWMPSKLEEQIKLFEDPAVDAVYSNFWLYRDSKKIKKTIAFRFSLPSGNIQSKLLQNYCIGILTLIIRRDSLLTLDYIFNPKYQIIGDYDLSLRLSEFGYIRAIQHPLAFYRWHENNLSKTMWRNEYKEMNHWSIEWRKQNLNKPVLIDIIDEKMKYLRAKYLILNSKKIAALKVGINIKNLRNKINIIVAVFVPNKLIKIARK